MSCRRESTTAPLRRAFLKGLTAYYLLHRTFKVGKGTVILFHAAAGGVGQIACQWAKALGATVIGTVGSDEKMALAKANGCDHVINYRSEDYVARIKEITGGAGVDVAYDSVGADTFPATLDCIRADRDMGHVSATRPARCRRSRRSC